MRARPCRGDGVLLPSLAALVLACSVAPYGAWAGEALHRRIDQLVADRAGEITFGTRATDPEYLRRIYLDLAGRIPTSDEARRFLDDKSPGKRGRLIDRLLNGPDYPRRMQELFHAMLMERRGDNEEWTKFLRAAFEQNMPWDQMARAIIKPDAEDEKARGAAYFVTARLVSEGAMAPVDVPGLTRDVGRLLAGVDMQCAQCHDHVNVDQYKQRDFQGLHVIFENVQTRRDVKFPAVAEKLMTDKKEYMSVFTQVPAKTGPVVPGGEEIEIVTFPKGEEYTVPPDRKKRTPGEPKFSPLKELARRLASEENPLFCRNFVNRMWFAMMGRGLVEPLDLQHSDNPATHPELLGLLAHEFAAREFNIKWLLRELALTDTYQRTSVVPEKDEAPPVETYALANEKRLSAEQLFWSAVVATGQLDVADSPELTALRQLFVKSFANPPKEPELEFEPTVKAALFLMHAPEVLGLLTREPGNFIDRLTKMTDVDEVADELFLAILSRPPTAEDRADVAEYLASNKDRRAEALAHLAWALLTSTEFCVNH